MIGRETRVLLRHYLEQGMSKAAIARQLGINRRTVHRWIAAGQLDRELDDEAAAPTVQMLTRQLAPCAAGLRAGGRPHHSHSRRRGTAIRGWRTVTHQTGREKVLEPFVWTGAPNCCGHGTYAYRVSRGHRERPSPASLASVPPRPRRARLVERVPRSAGGLGRPPRRRGTVCFAGGGGDPGP